MKFEFTPHSTGVVKINFARSYCHAGD